MITFACKKIKQEDLIRCSFSLNKAEYRILILLMEKKRAYNTNQISKRMQWGRTNIQKALKGLLRKKLVKRNKQNLPRGGYIFSYEVNDKRYIKERLRAVLHTWYEGAEREIDSW